MSTPHKNEPGSPRSPGETSTGLSPRSQVLTLLSTDLVDSVSFKRRLGDAEAGKIINRHIAEVRTLAFALGGAEVFTAGDGFFLTFEASSAAVQFALLLQKAHRDHADWPRVRIGIHVGEVTVLQREKSAGTGLDVEGLAVDFTNQLQALALPSQVLLTFSAFDSARQRLPVQELDFRIAWQAHGKYRFRGQDDGTELFEVGLESFSPLSAPPANSAAAPIITADTNDAPGWRPAQGLEIPGLTNWILKEKLNVGNCDTWLAEHAKSKERRVFKFCYAPAGLASLRREISLFRVLRAASGARQDIARVLDYQLEHPPYYLEMEYFSPTTLPEWLDQHGGLKRLDPNTAIQLVTAMAEAFGAAHSVGVLHSDIRPDNILVKLDAGQTLPQVQVTEFGISSLMSQVSVEAPVLVRASAPSVSAGSPEVAVPSPLYAAPELFEGKALTVQSEIYALGVLLYQLLCRDLNRALASGWQRDIPDALLAQDIEACVDHDPRRRLGSMQELASRLTNLEARRQRQAEEERQQTAIKLGEVRRRKLNVYLTMGAVFLITLITVARVLNQQLEEETRLRLNSNTARAAMERSAALAAAARQTAERAQYQSAIALAQIALEQGRINAVRDTLLNDTPPAYRNLEWGWLFAQTSPENWSLNRQDTYDAVFSPDGSRFVAVDRDGDQGGRVRLFSTLSGEQLAQQSVHRRLIWDVAFSRDGSRLGTASSDKEGAVLDAQTLAVVCRLKGHNGILRGISFSPDGSKVTTVARDNTLRIWDAVTGTQLDVLEAGSQDFSNVLWHDDGRWIFTTSLRGRAQQWDVEKRTVVAELGGASDHVLALCAGPDGTVITGSKDGKIRAYSAERDDGTSPALPRIEHAIAESWPSALSYNSVDKTLFVGCDSGKCVLLGWDKGQPVTQVEVDEPLWKADMARDGRHVLVTGRWSTRLLDMKQILEPCEVSDLPSAARHAEVQTITVNGIINSRDVSWEEDKPWRTPSGKSLAVKGPVRVVANSFFSPYSPDGKYCVRINDSTLSATAVDASTGRVLASLGDAPVCSAAVSPDSSLVATATIADEVTLWSAADWHPVAKLRRGENYCTTVRFSDDTSMVAVGYMDGVINVYNTRTQQLVNALPKTLAQVITLDFSSDGSHLASGNSNDRCYIYDLKTSDIQSTMTGHVRYVHSVEFSPDGTRLLTAARDGKAKLWDVGNGRELVDVFTVSGKRQIVNAFFCKRSRRIAALTSDRQLLVTEYFPWKLEDYDGIPGDDLSEKIEELKRRERLETYIPKAAQ